MKLSHKAILISLLVPVLIVLSIYYQNNYAQHSKYPVVEALISNSSEYINSTISFHGKVISRSNDSFLLSVSYEGKSMVFNIYSHAYPGVGTVEVLGVLHKDDHIQAEKIIVLQKWKIGFLYFRSVVAFILLLSIFTKEWRFDISNMRFY